MKNLTVIIPAFNEEHYIQGAIHSVLFATKIIVIDSFSTDDTVAIAESFGCEIVQRKFDNFSNQKNYALQFATTEWVLFVDADERIPYKLQQEIKTAIHSNTHSAYKLNFPHFYMNRFLYHHSDHVTRLVKRTNAHFEGSVHEKLIIKGTIGKLKNPVLHYTYKGLIHYISKKDSYAWFQAKQLLKKKKKQLTSI
ncbi:glycosyltransferase family 2 protein [Aquimarina agarivorans]|uniref:glycosyltransferase family 2 protein n=1 Tax=Aquimarina agarivorans TaxID=980584 RepID=UPI000248E947|nr:glycosyltransferase family 2 protein [Aquimarina agarivorans]